MMTNNTSKANTHFFHTYFGIFFVVSTVLFISITLPRPGASRRRPRRVAHGVLPSPERRLSGHVQARKGRRRQPLPPARRSNSRLGKGAVGSVFRRPPPEPLEVPISSTLSPSPTPLLHLQRSVSVPNTPPLQDAARRAVSL